MIYTVYGVRNKNSSRIGERFACGSKLPYRSLPCNLLEPGGAAMYGDGHGLRPLLQQAIDEDREWVYLDNGYFKPGHYGGYYRITRNAYSHSGYPESSVTKRSALRWARLGLKIRPWTKGGGFILVCPPGEAYGRWRGLDLTAWLEDALKILRQHTDREIRVRQKPPVKNRARNPIQQALNGAHALVTYASVAAVESLLEGVPVFCNAPESECPAYHMAERNFSKIETPLRPEQRFEWACALASNQWKMAEIESGQCWHELMEKQSTCAAAN